MEVSLLKDEKGINEGEAWCWCSKRDLVDGHPDAMETMKFVMISSDVARINSEGEGSSIIIQEQQANDAHNRSLVLKLVHRYYHSSSSLPSLTIFSSPPSHSVDG